MGHVLPLKKIDLLSMIAERLLRYYQSKSMVTQVGEDAYEPSNISRALATTGGAAGISYLYVSVKHSLKMRMEANLLPVLR